MKNIHVLPTNNSSRLCKDELGTFHITESMISKVSFFKNQNIYITNDEEIKEGDWFLNTLNGKLDKCDDIIYEKNVKHSNWCKKIILTTDQDLIADGVQAIDDEFLEWFVKNPSCESVKVEKRYSDFTVDPFVGYKIIIPQEEPKLETLEEAAERLSKDAYKKHSLKDDTFSLDEQIQRRGGFIVGFTEGLKEGAKWQQEQDKNKYSEVEVIQILINYQHYLTTNEDRTADEWFEQFKKK
jgi:hypothetical protein